ncbi:alpha/beta hydrolase [Agrobacterium larrymoorei]|uniref:alpha/beta hydrolase fold domain-containing protein n=1 Tax=Agrobacterium larrymoorei TaxID=160699 RepID=UPI0015723B92|nr:alpha/beta hydrolase fold domain-containing protein [Agrobacterium larrymoorei]NTJ43564.1 alpha/beta hydrolase [Agrobacterium larrymoorei]
MQTQWQQIGSGTGPKPPLLVRRYEGAQTMRNPPVVLYLRGGSFLEERSEYPELPIARALADEGVVVVEANYSKASGNEFPMVIDFAYEALDHLDRERKTFGSAKSPLFVAGEEAGGNVAAGLAIKARDRMPGKLAGQVLLSPMIDPMMTTESFRDADRIGMRQRWADGWSHYLAKACGFFHPYAAPCQCTRLDRVAPALIFTADDDPLRDETVGYAERLKASDVCVRQHTFPSGIGWTGLYRGDGGQWVSSVCSEFMTFVKDLKH